MTDRHIVAMGGGGFSQEPDNPLLDRFVLDLARRVRGRERPRVCFLPTASGDAEGYIAGFHAAFDPVAEASHLQLFTRPDDPLDPYLLDQDLVYVGGGNTANMVLIWRLHGVDRILRQAWEAGTVLAGLSAGALCWFECGVTDSFGPSLARPLHDGLALLSGSFCPHYDGEELRRPTYHELVGRDLPDGLPAGLAADDGAAVHFVGTELVEAVASRPAARAYRVGLVDGAVREIELPTRYLGS
jgi:peptidase E